MSHLLLERSHRFAANSDEPPIVGWTYDRESGVWYSDARTPEYPGPQPKPSKKSDIETGEDMKGP